MQISVNGSPKTLFTRMCIGEAIVALLKEGENTLRSLKVSAVVLKAGVSRVTFYKYYGTLRAALQDYLHIVIAEYVQTDSSVHEWHDFLSYEHILSALRFFDRYRSFFLTMKRQGQYSLLIDSVNAFITEHIPISAAVSSYKRYAYAGSLLNCFMMWEENGKQDAAEDVAMTLHQLYGMA